MATRCRIRTDGAGRSTFESAWVAVLTGLVYVLVGWGTGHFRKNLLPSGAALSPSALGGVVLNHLRFRRVEGEDAYNPLQRITYLLVIFGAFPAMIWTGLAMSPAVTSVWPFVVTLLGGHQSARTIHFIGTLVLALFVVVHLLMLCLSGFWKRTRAMITGGSKEGS